MGGILKRDPATLRYYVNNFEKTGNFYYSTENKGRPKISTKSHE